MPVFIPEPAMIKTCHIRHLVSLWPPMHPENINWISRATGLLTCLWGTKGPWVSRETAHRFRYVSGRAPSGGAGSHLNPCFRVPDILQMGHKDKVTQQELPG